MSKFSYAIIGTGAIGGFYGALLQKAGHEVHFLLNSDYQHVRTHGLIIDSKLGDFTLPNVNAHNDPASIPPVDVAIVALKTTENHLLPNILPQVIKDTGCVVILQNGLGMDQFVAGIVGPGRVVGGVCFICSNKPAPGYINHLDYGAVTLAEYSEDKPPQPISDRIKTIAADLKQTGIEVRISTDLPATRWTKLVWNIPFNGLSVVLRQSTDLMMQHPDSKFLIQTLMTEVITAARANHVNLNDNIAQKMLDNTAQMTPYKTSMMIDFDLHRPLEIDAIFAQPLAQATQAGASTPYIDCLYHQLKSLDFQNQTLNTA